MTPAHRADNGAPTALERAVFVGRVGGHGLGAVPHLDDLAALEAEQVHDRQEHVAELQPRVHGDSVAVGEGVPDLELFVRELGLVSDHPRLQGLHARGSEDVVVLPAHIDVLSVGLFNLARRDQLQEIDGGPLLMIGIRHESERAARTSSP